VHTSVLVFEAVSKQYESRGRQHRFALRNVSLQIEPGQTIALVGRSGSGKSTLLHLAAGIDTPTEGRIHLDGHDLTNLREKARTLLRRNHVGLIYQFFHLLPHLTVLENIALPEWIDGRSTRSVRDRILQLLERVDLVDRRDDPVQNLSGGEMQRVAICRALLKKPTLLLADEPTGNLDDVGSRAVMDLLLGMTHEESRTLLYVTHSMELAQRADTIWRLHSGKLVIT